MEGAPEERDRWVDIGGMSIHVREWPGQESCFVLIHGLASNCRTWERVAAILHSAGHTVYAVDQRGHGLSDKPDRGYGFDVVTLDLLRLLGVLAPATPPLLVGQSWGGNVVLDFAAHHPGEASGLVLVDGGFIEMSARHGATWEKISVELRPPALEGMERAYLKSRISQGNPDWTEEGVEATLANFETLPDGTVRPWLTLERHMEILRALWEHRPTELYPAVREPVLLAPATRGTGKWEQTKREEVGRAESGLARCRVRWFQDTDHDIHVHRPAELAATILEAVDDGFLAGKASR